MLPASAHQPQKRLQISAPDKSMARVTAVMIADALRIPGSRCPRRAVGYWSSVIAADGGQDVPGQLLREQRLPE